MNDREMFEFAAKAAGWFAQNWTWVEGEGFVYQLDGRRVVWNPRDNDGDALRLAHAVPMIVTPGTARLLDGRLFGADNKDIAATRLAIFRAAAEIGKNMK